MAQLDVKRNLIQGKIVYYGPGLCGKTTNLEYINASLKGAKEMVSLATQGDRTIFFDFLPLEVGKIRGVNTSFKLYTVPGQVRYNLTRKMVLKNVDGLVFVADSQRLMMDSNIESWENLFSNLRELKIDPETVPILLQYNKRDLKDVLSREELDKALNQNGRPVLMASAVTGEGVVETLARISGMVFDKMSKEFGGDLPAAEPRQELRDAKGKPKVSTRKTWVRPGPAGAEAGAEARARDKAAEGQDAKIAPPADKYGAKPERAAPDGGPPAAKKTARAAAQKADAPVAQLPAKEVDAVPVDRLRQLLSKYNKKHLEITEASLDKLVSSVSATVEKEMAELGKKLADNAKVTPLDEKEKKELRDLLSQLSEQANRHVGAEKGLEDLRKAAEAVRGQADDVAYLKRSLGQMQSHVTAIAEQVKPGIEAKGDAPAAKELQELRNQMAAIAEQVKSGMEAKRDAPAAKELQELRNQMAAIAEQVKGGMEAKGETPVAKELQELRNQMAAMAPAANDSPTSKDFEELRSQIAAIAEQLKRGIEAKGGAPAASELQELTSQVAAVAAQVKESLANKASVDALQKSFSALLSQNEARVAQVERSVKAAIDELRSALTSALDKAPQPQSVQMRPDAESDAAAPVKVAEEDQEPKPEKAEAEAQEVKEATAEHEEEPQPEKAEAEAQEVKDKPAEDIELETEKAEAEAQEVKEGTAEHEDEPRPEKAEAEAQEVKDKPAEDIEPRPEKAEAETQEVKDKPAEDIQPRPEKAEAEAQEVKDKPAEDIEPRPEKAEAEAREVKEGTAEHEEEPQPEKAEPQAQELKDKPAEDIKPETEKAAPQAPQAPDKAEGEKHPEPEEDLSDDPQHKNAARVARVMVADLTLYYRDDIVEGIKAGDIHERLKNQFDEMRKTFAARVPQDVRDKKDYLQEAIDNFVEKKSKELGVG